MNIQKFLTILTLILFPFGELLRFNFGNNITIKPIDIFVGLTALLWLINYIIQKPKNILGLKILPFTLIALLSLLINSFWLKPPELLASLFYLARWVAYASLYYVVITFDKNFKNIIKRILFTDGLIIVILGFAQYFFFPSLKSLYYLGWDEHLYRIFSVFLDPNYTGAFYTLYFLFTIDMLFKQKKPLWYLYITPILTLIAVFLTFSRSALLTLIVGTCAYLFLIKKKIYTLILFGAITLFIIISARNFGNENMNLLRNASVIARINNYITAIKIITDKPFLGVGFNTYRYAKKLYGVQMGWVEAPSHADAGVDNSFLFILATTGIPGFLAYILLWFNLLKKSSALIISSSLALFINALFINSLFFPPLMLWMWIILALL